MNRQIMCRVSLASIVAVTLACGLMGNPTRSTSKPTEVSTGIVPNETSTPQPTSNLFENAPTPILTAQVPPAEHTFADTKVSGETGSVIIEDFLASTRLHILLEDANSKKPVSQVQVQFVSDGKTFALAVLDPTGQYFPKVTSGLLSSLSSENPSSRYRTVGFGVSSAKASGLAQAGWRDVELVLKLVEAIEAVTAVRDIVELLKDLPSLEKWSIGYSEFCWTGDQMADAVGVVSGVAGIALPISGAALTSTMGNPELGYMLASMVALSMHKATEDAQSYLTNLPGTHRLRIYHFNIPFTFSGIEYLGRCETAPTSGDLIYITGQLGNQQLWLRDLSKPEPFELVRGAQVYGLAGPWYEGIVYGNASQVGGPFDVYLADQSGKNALRIASGVDQGFGGRSPDGSKMLVRWIRGDIQGLDLMDIGSGQVQALVQAAEFTGGWWMNSGRNISFTVRQNNRDMLYVVEANLREPPRLLAEGTQIFPMSLNNADYLVWDNYSPTEQSVHIFNPEDGSSRELLRAPNIRWAMLKNRDVTFTLDKRDGTEQYFLLRGSELQEMSAQIVDISPNDEYFIYQKNFVQYIGKPNSNDFQQLVADDMKVYWTRFTTDSRYVVYIAASKDESEFAVFSLPTFGEEAKELGRFDTPPWSSDRIYWNYPSGTSIQFTSQQPDRAGFAVSPSSTSVLLHWSWTIGKEDSAYRISLTDVDGSSNTVISEGIGVLTRQPQFTPDGQSILTVVQGSNGLKKLDVYQADGKSTNLISDASAISFQFTRDRKYAVVTVTANVGGSNIYLLDLATLTTERIAEGIDAQLIAPFSLDGLEPWQ